MAVDELGRKLGEKTVSATTEGHVEALAWSCRWAARRWALEDCRHLTRLLESDLLAAGEMVIRVPPHLMAESRRSGREQGKSDPIDALAVARAALREPNLPMAKLDGDTRQLRLLVDHREDLVGERTRMFSRLRWHLHELFPGQTIPPRALRRFHILTDLAEQLERVDGMVAEIARELVTRCRELTTRINQLERHIARVVRRLAPKLLELPGCGVLTAAKIIGETAGAGRFHSKAAFARWNGTAPIPVWSGNTDHFRLNRGGNRQVNAALHVIALTQVRDGDRGQGYVAGRMAAGDTRKEAIRLLRRRLSDEVFRRLLVDEAASNSNSDGQRSAA